MANPFPTVDKALLEKLEELFPNHIPDEPPSEREAARLVGQQDVLRRLRVEHRRQTEIKP